MIKAIDLKKTYPGKSPTEALKGVSLSIDSGTFACVMGRSGSGKSTLLHQLALIDTPSAGRIFLMGKDVSAMSESEKSEFRLNNLGFVFQDYALIYELTALENVYLPAMAMGKNAKECREHARELLDYVGLKGLAHHHPSAMSGGEQQRAAIARSLINRPRIVFADEPTANLDSTAAAGVLELFQRLNQELSLTIVMVTHEEEDKKYAGQIICLKDGLIESIQHKEGKRHE